MRLAHRGLVLGFLKLGPQLRHCLSKGFIFLQTHLLSIRFVALALQSGIP